MSSIHNWYCSSVECVRAWADQGRRASIPVIHCWLVIKLFAIFGRRHRHRRLLSTPLFQRSREYTKYICYDSVSVSVWCHEIHTCRFFFFSEMLSWLIKFAVPFIFMLQREEEFCVDFPLFFNKYWTEGISECSMQCTHTHTPCANWWVSFKSKMKRINTFANK